MIEQLKAKTKVIKKFMDSQNMDFLVVGSGALLMCGIPMSREPHDIDIEVICTEDREDIFKILHGSMSKGSPGKPYIFTLKNDILVNVWVVKEFTHKHFIECDGVKYASVYSVLKKKMSYKREKDIKDLYDIIIELIKLSDEKITNYPATNVLLLLT